MEAEHAARNAAVTYGEFPRAAGAYNIVGLSGYAARPIATCTRLRPSRLAA